MTTFDALRRACGITQMECAELFGVSISSVKQWCSGRRRPHATILVHLAGLEGLVERTAAEAVTLAASQSRAEVIELGAASDDAEALSLGWPCASVHAALLGRVAARLIQAGRRVVVVPRART